VEAMEGDRERRNRVRWRLQGTTHPAIQEYITYSLPSALVPAPQSKHPPTTDRRKVDGRGVELGAERLGLRGEVVDFFRRESVARRRGQHGAAAPAELLDLAQARHLLREQRAAEAPHGEVLHERARVGVGHELRRARVAAGGGPTQRAEWGNGGADEFEEVSRDRFRKNSAYIIHRVDTAYGLWTAKGFHCRGRRPAAGARVLPPSSTTHRSTASAASFSALISSITARTLSSCGKREGVRGAAKKEFGGEACEEMEERDAASQCGPRKKLTQQRAGRPRARDP
jgi:hypothetical protein